MPLDKHRKAREALGQFVEAFEGMVHETRSIAIRLLSIPTDIYHTELIQIALHHQVLTAKPIFEIVRAIIIEIVNASIQVQQQIQKHAPEFPSRPIDFTLADREIFFGVLKTIADEFFALANTRNNLLHAAWFIGYDSSIEFDVHKYAVTKEGLSRIELPSKTTELLTLSDRCNHIIPWLHKIEACVTGMYKISEHFERSGSDWIMSAGHTTLPKK
jgi:hypothetical protein